LRMVPTAVGVVIVAPAAWLRLAEKISSGTCSRSARMSQ
jgi:hypothetical protein